MAFWYEADIMKLPTKGWFAGRWLLFCQNQIVKATTVFNEKTTKTHDLCTKLLPSKIENT